MLLNFSLRKCLILFFSILFLASCSSKGNLQNLKQKILWYDVNSKTNETELRINKEYLKSAPDPVKAILAYYSSQYGTECKWANDSMNEDMSNLDCGLTSALGIGFQCSETHRSFIKQWFQDEPRIIQKIESCYNVPWTATSQSSISLINIEIKNDSLIVEIKIDGVNLREETFWNEHRLDIYFYDGEKIRILDWKVINDNNDGAEITNEPARISEPIYYEDKQCGCSGDTLMNTSTTDCKTRILNDQSKLYYQFNCDSIWLTLENSEKHVIFSMSTELYSYTYRLGFQFSKEFDKYILFRTGCPANGPCNFVLVDKQTGKIEKELGELIYDHGNDKFYDFLIYFSDQTSLTLYYVNRDEKFKIPIDAKYFNRITPEYQFDEVSLKNDTLTLLYSYELDDKPGNNTIKVDLKKYVK